MTSIAKSLRGAGAAAAFAMGLTAPVLAAEPGELGKYLAATCANGHGTNGKAIGDGARLAGKPADELVRTMEQFREGKKAATIMHQIAKGYTPEQIRLMAEFFAAQD